jgi:predicted aldo/keto reductase-like oxidoreductase
MGSSLSRRTFLATTAAGAGLAAGAESAAAEPAAQKSTMPLRPLGKTGWLISIVGFGGGSRFLLQDDLEVAEKMIDRAVELGINYFDTAYGYRKGDVRESHNRYGRFLVPKYRKQITLSSKVGARDAETAKRQLEETLDDLKTDHLDVLHFHGIGAKSQVDQIIAKDGALTAFRKWKEEGVIGAIGMTGHDSQVLADGLRRIQPDCVMCPQNPAHAGVRCGGYPGLNFARDVNPYALEHGIGLMAMKTTAQNRLIGKGGIKVEELVRYALALPVAAAVIGMPNMEVVESNARIARTLTRMSDEERKRINQQVALAGGHKVLPYMAADYVDGECLA